MKVFFGYTAMFAFCLGLSIFYRFYLNDPARQLVVNRVFLLLEFFSLSVFYFVNIRSLLKRWILPLAVVGFSLYSALDMYQSPPGEFSFVPLVAESFFFLLVILFYMYDKLRYEIERPIYYSPAFWVSVAFLIYFSGNFFLFLFSRSMFKDPSFRFDYTLIYSSFTIVKNILLSAAIIVNANLVIPIRRSVGEVELDLGSFNTFANQHN